MPRVKKTFLVNSNNKPCSSKNFTSCCPHMPQNEKKQYAATTRMKPLYYRGKKYKLYTCCPMCADAMNKLSKTNVDKFDRVYRAKIHKGKLMLANKHTRRYVQKASIF